ncbi:MAG: ComEC/Rec2 family competence protein, partial [Oscillospiraceae bacterium]|nr:ComEC/Rec2 family competence protein [Oscillospiraceae bacterium]
ISIIVGIVFLLKNTDVFKEPHRPISSVESSCAVYFIDVGQGDSTLISTGGVNVLIDAGENNRGDEVLLKLGELGIKKLHYVIGTHAHSDHIGGLDTVLNGIEVENIILSDLPEKVIPTTKTYTDLLEAIVENEVELIAADVGDSFEIGQGKLSILAPVTDKYTDQNSWSIITRFEFGETSFLFTGDAEQHAEKDLLDSGADVDADLLKVGHHGSDTSSSKAFLEAVSPDYAVIEVGAGNKYGHPMAEALTRLQNLGAEVYRTDLDGCITAISDGKDIVITTEKE